MARRKYIQTQNEAINSLIIQSALISPIEEILANLKNYNFRDCDIKWLDEKLYSFIDFSAKTLGISITFQPSKFVTINEYVRSYYLDKFSNLLSYFKKF